MAFDGLTPSSTQTKRPEYIRDEFQYILGELVGMNCILPEDGGDYGFRINSYSGLDVGISGGRSVLNRKWHKKDATTTVTLTANKSGLIYQQKNTATDSVTPTFGSVYAQAPTFDGNSLIQYVFSEDSNPQDGSGNGNHIATLNGTTKVNGIFGYGREFNGTSDYMVSTLAPSGISSTAVREQLFCFMPLRITGTQIWVTMGSTTNRWFALRSVGARLYAASADTDASNDTGYDLEIGKVYTVSMAYDGTNIIVKINGVPTYSTAVVLNTNGTTIRFGSSTSGTNFAKGVYYYYEMRSAIRTIEQNAAISNKFLIPCTYRGWLSQYPTNDATAGTHTYKFDETGGNSVADDQATMIGTATGTTIVDSEIGLNKSRKFNGTSGDYVNFGNYTFPAEFSIIFVGNISDLSANRPIFSNHNGTNGNLLYCTSSLTSGISLKCNGTTVTSVSGVPTGIPVFIGITVKSNVATFYVNSSNIDNIVAITPNSSNNNALYLGIDTPNAIYHKGTAELFYIVPKGLSQSDMAMYYNTLMQRGKRDIRNDVLSDKSNQNVIAYVRTDDTKLIAYDDDSWKYGRRNDYRQGFGNRKKWLGLQYYSGATDRYWTDPFGTRNVNAQYYWAEDATGKFKTIVLYDASYSYNDGCPFTPFKMHVSTNAAFFMGSAKTVGYIDCLAEVTDND